MYDRNPHRGKWIPELVYHPDDHHVGAEITQLTCQPSIATSIYCEDPFCSAACNRIVVLRGQNSMMHGPQELWLVDLNYERSMLIDDDVYGGAHAMHSYGDHFFYRKYQSNDMYRLTLSTLDQDHVFTFDDEAMAVQMGTGSASPDGRYLAGHCKRGTPYVFVIDLNNGTTTKVIEGEEFFNPHPRFDRIDGQLLCIQWNRGQKWDLDSHRKVVTDPDVGTTLVAVSLDGKTKEHMVVSKPDICAGISGHESWVSGKRQIIVSLAHADPPYNDGDREGNLITYELGADKPSVITHDPDGYYGHVSASRCGKYWICDRWDRRKGKVTKSGTSVVIGSMTSGKKAVLCDVGDTWSRFEAGHCHPYMTADNRRVIFGSMKTGLPQVFAATIPDGFLASLD